LGKRDLTLTNPDGGTSTFGSTAGQSGFVVATVPAAPTGVSVTTGNGSATVTWSAPSTDGGSPVTSYVVGDGDSGTPNQVVQAAQARTATFTGLTNGRTYTFSVTAANAVGTGPAGTRQGTPYTVPSAPTTVTATPQDAQVALAWSPAAANGSGVTGYLVHETAGKVPDISLGAVTSTVVTGLTNGSAYSFQVRARNAAGNGAFSAATAAVTPRYATVLTSKRYPSATTVAGTTVHYLGRLSRSRTGAALSGARVTLSLRPGVGSTVTVALTTDAYGNWSYYAKPVYNTYASARFGGDSVDAPASAASYLKLVAPRITVTSPRNGSSSGAGTVLVVKGSISPNKSGKRLELYRVLSGGKLQPIAAATVSRTSTWQFSIKPSRGTYVFRVGIGGTTGNAGALSSAFKVYRT
ncbi:MAG: fibronectin type III domain-containing protein, partial [Nocardioidaceae bacterium]